MTITFANKNQAVKEHNNTRAFITFEGAAALLTVEDTAEYQAASERINKKYDGKMREAYLGKVFEGDFDAAMYYDKLLKAKGEEQDALAEEFVFNANIGIGAA